jgi:hypothetical protein
LIVGLALLAAPSPSGAQEPGRDQEPRSLPQRFSALAANLISDRPGLGAVLLEITITRWSTSAERDELVAGAGEGGTRQLVRLLQRQKPVGTIRSMTGTGYDLRYAGQEPTAGGGRHLFIMTDRPMFSDELTSLSRTVQYPLTVIDISLGPKGEGSGTMSVASKVIAAGQLFVIENWELDPIRLTLVKQER